MSDESSSDRPRKQPPKRPRNLTHPVRETPSSTGPFDLLHGRKAIALLDQTGLIRDAFGRGQSLQMQQLAMRIKASTDSCDLISLARVECEDEDEIREILTMQGWKPLFVSHDFTPLVYGMPVLPDRDAIFIGAAIGLAILQRPDVVLLGTPQASLAISYAHAVRLLNLDIEIVTLAMAQSTASWLTPQMCDEIAGNVVIGSDCLKTIPTTSPEFEEEN